MKWVQLTPVRAGDLLQVTICGIDMIYRAKIDADDVLNLKLRDMELVKPK